MKIEALAQTIFDDILNHGGEVYIVGGTVRDEMMGYCDQHDVDVEVYHLSYNQLCTILQQYGHVNTFGQSFAIVQLDTLPHYDFALPRQEKKTGHKHQDFETFIDPDLPLEKAILRRDLTINALMYDYQHKKIIDLSGGLEDLHRHIIRCVDEKRFIEDPLRVLRVARFIAKLQFEVEPQTKALCRQMVEQHMLDNLSKERVYQEYSQILMTDMPSLGFQFLKDIGALPPYLQALTTTNQRLDFHPEGDVFTHTMLVIDVASHVKQKTDQPLWFMWSCLLHDIGKPLVTTEQGHAPLHNEAGVEVFQTVDFITSKKARQYIQTMIMYHMHLMNMSRHHARDISYLRLLKKIDGKVSMNDLIYISCCDKLGRGKVAQSQYDEFWIFIQDKQQRLGNQALPAIIDGHDLIENGFQNKQMFKKILEEAYDLQLQGYRKEKILRSLRKYEQG
ncbi:HD domain-containing protein [Allocoprobacillus halotolerans]|uniref:HD domain-containing protein n=1 Tax=Allocoprobacillus halotolerans TaxID=2944914 RepID=A0ABY5I6J7_9FIRM|nr:HD domain-containing protein [Allocoprobacillus halotolerans]UTY39673.1 HD domain-containing protein [Allocoprobacillus halotolerans]